jgi:hypothetical protein
LDPLPSPFSSIDIILSTAMSSESPGSDDEEYTANIFRWMSDTAAESDTTSSVSLRSSAGALALWSRGASGSEATSAAMSPRAAHGVLFTRPATSDSASDTASATASCRLPEVLDLDQLLYNPRVVSLDISGPPFTALFLEKDTHHEHCVSGQRYTMDDKLGCSLADMFYFGVLRSFRLRCTCCIRMGDMTGIALATALQESRSVQSFTLYCECSSMGDDTGIALAMALQENRSVQSFTLWCDDTSMGDATGIALATALQESRSVQTFELRCNNTSMGDATGSALATALQERRSVQTFELHCNNHSMGDATGIALATALQESRSVQSFTLSCTGISMGDATGIALATALQESRSVQSFKLGCTRTSMGDATGIALAAALQESQSVQSFTLCCDRTSMGDATGIALATALKESQSVQVFCLNCADISMGDATGIALGLAVKESLSLLSFKLWGSESISEDTRTVLMTALNGSVTLKSFEVNLRDEWGLEIDLGPWQSHVDDVLARNRQLPSHWLGAVCFARHAASKASLGMSEAAFRRLIFSYFLPEGALERLAARAADRRSAGGASIAPIPFMVAVQP